MKQLSKLRINSEKLMKNEELIELRGGYGGDGECCGNNCDSSPCCDACPRCDFLPNWNDGHKYCTSP